MTYQVQANSTLALIEKAAKAHDSNDALKFSQAACNSANALSALLAQESFKKTNE